MRNKPTNANTPIYHAPKIPAPSNPNAIYLSRHTINTVAHTIRGNALQTSGSGGDETKIRLTGVQDTRQVFGVELHTHIPRMVLELYNLHADPFVIFPDELEPLGVKTVDVIWVHFVPVSMSLENLLLLAVQLAQTRPLGTFLEQGRAETETHSTAKIHLVDLRHENDHWVGALLVKLDR